VIKSKKSAEMIAVIAGAGPAGLTAAYELKKRTNIQPIVYEVIPLVEFLRQPSIRVTARSLL
jgi:flavin-dependent dehydrogenase